MRKPTHASRTSTGSRHQAGVMWRKSSYSLPDGACVEVAQAPVGHVLFRDSKVDGGPVVTVSKATAALFALALDRGDL
ncbi:hypothetical protein EASAB2608_06551 [Streptomyces sp. EAS-AB2608]|nr:hypothetical protein EASAB2608_06551 [Streptomyces sp. EAS-AB2608]